jgi:hypothetical protein
MDPTLICGKEGEKLGSCRLDHSHTKSMIIGMISHSVVVGLMIHE